MPAPAAFSKVELVAKLREKGLVEIAESVFEVIHHNDENIGNVKDDVRMLKQALIDIECEIEDLKKGFPDENIYGHRLYHEKQIRAHLSDEKVKSDLKKDMIMKMIMFVVGLVVAGIAAKYGITALAG